MVQTSSKGYSFYSFLEIPWEADGEDSLMPNEISCEGLFRRVVAIPRATPYFPVIKGNFQHGFGGFVKPTAFAPGEVALDRGDRFRASEMNVGRLPAHAVSELFFVRLFRQGLDFDVAAIGGQAANDPMGSKMDVRIPYPHGTFDELPAQHLRGVEMPSPDPGGGRELLGFADDMRAIPGGKSEDARVAQTSEAGDAGFQLVIQRAKRHGIANKLPDVFGQLALVFRAGSNFLPEGHRIAELIQSNQAEPLVMFGKNEGAAPFGYGVAITLLHGPNR